MAKPRQIPAESSLAWEVGLETERTTLDGSPDSGVNFAGSWDYLEK
ncbi:hypothetical protein GCM10009560_22360 [Nonomuraea longicatena]|jgi:hypothetical protein|uniref:Uncharacterized protein n=1 Tax=Nonomuraea longicatena TaxID=83682 RepID=A0ABP3ZIX4_9ACTN